ncbi:MerR family transcriptional regulator [Kitasatospora arboriphila]
MADLWSIGELAERAGVTVKTVRFYSDRGLLPEAARSTGGHRRYGPGALDRLRLIRSLRALDLPVPEIDRVLRREDTDTGADALEDAVARQLKELGTQLAALRWREAALQLLRDCTAEERADRLRLIGAVATPPDTTALARYWRRVLPRGLSTRQIRWIVDAAVPQPPAEPRPPRCWPSPGCTPSPPCPAPPAAATRRPRRTPATTARPCSTTASARRTSWPPRPCAGEGTAAGRGARLLRRRVRRGPRRPGHPAVPPRLVRRLDALAHPVMDRYWQLAANSPTRPPPPSAPPTTGSAQP